MAYKLIIKPDAFGDINHAMAWYKEQEAGLEHELLLEIFEAIGYIKNYPKHAQERYREFRVRYTNRFAYGIHYTVEGESIFVHAVMHTSRKTKL